MAIDDEKEKRERIMEAANRPRPLWSGEMRPAGHNGLEYASGLVSQGMRNHANAANAINSAISNEMDSRVAQQREMRRMAHEKEMMRMRLEAQRRDEEGGIIRSLLNG